MMPKQLLISYTGKLPVEVDLAGAMKREEVKAKKEKRESAFQRLAVAKSGTLTLRKNTTAVVSPSELEAIKEAMGERFFKRNVVEHGEYKTPRSQRPKEAKGAPQEAASGLEGKGTTTPGSSPDAAPGDPSGDKTTPAPEVTVSGKGGKKKPGDK